MVQGRCSDVDDDPAGKGVRLRHVTDVEPGERIVALKNVTANEHFFVGHFPGFPVMPGVLIVEAMAQTSGLLALHGRRMADGEYMMFAGIDKARFRQAVVPGDTLRITIEALRMRARSAHMRGEATVDGKVVAEAEILSVIGKRPDASASEWWCSGEER